MKSPIVLIVDVTDAVAKTIRAEEFYLTSVMNES